MLRKRARTSAFLVLVAAFVAPVAWERVALAQPAPAGSAAPPAADPPTTQPPPTTTTTVPAPHPAADTQDLVRQGQQRPGNEGAIPSRPTDVFSDDWWGRARPIFELHGYFRTRAELHHNFFLGRHDAPGSTDNQNLAPQPIDQSYTDTSGQPRNVSLCGPASGQPCYDKTQSTANLRLRLDPELHISDNLRIVSQLDLLNNLVLGSTPNSYAMVPSAAGNGSTVNGYGSAGFNPYAPLGFNSTTQGAPTAGVNSYQNSINVNRVWGEYQTPVGQLRFGRMPSQWGLGMVQNSGDGIDSDYQTTTDRIMFVTGIKSLDLYFGGMWDFVSTGPTNATPFDVYGGQPSSLGNLTNVNQWGLFVAHRTNPELQRLALSRGDPVINGGLFAQYRSQNLDVTAGQTAQTTAVSTANNNGLELRNAQAFIPDLWVQFLYRKFRFEAEFAAIYGQIGNSPISSNISSPVPVREYGLATQTEYRAIDDKLRLQFGFGWASGDQWQQTLNPGTGAPTELNGKGPISEFAFHPDYKVDLIFFRNILSRIEGAYYFRPSVDYDFLKNPNGQKFGGGAAVIWSRASEFVQSPGHSRDLGVEMDAQLYFQSKDGSLNDDPEKLGGFYAMLQYGFFYPLGGLEYLPGEQTNKLADWSLSTAHIVRAYLGIVF